MTSQKERRAHQRFSCEQAVVLKKDMLLAHGTIRDVSAGGLYISVRSDDFEVGDTITAVLDSNAGDKIRVQVTLARIRKDSFGHVTAMGLKVTDEGPSRQAWEEHVASLSKD